MLFNARIIVILTFIVDKRSSSLYLTSKPPKVDFESKTLTACDDPLYECPISDTDKEKREVCYFGYSTKRCSAGGQHYGCGRDPVNGFLVEGCFDRHVCSPGSSNRIISNLDTKMATLSCMGCDEDHYQPVDSNSSVETLNGCSYGRFSDALRNDLALDSMILVEKGWPTRVDKYVCNINKGYSDLNKQMYCYVNKPCVCTKGVVCREKDRPDLLPNGSCDIECEGVRNQRANFSCSSYVQNGSNAVTKGNTTTKVIHGKENKDAEGKQIPWLPIVIAVLVVLVVAGLIILICCRCTKCRRNIGRRYRMITRCIGTNEQAARDPANVGELLNREPEGNDNREPAINENREPGLHNNREPESDDNREPEVYDNREPGVHNNREPESDDNREPEVYDNRESGGHDNGEPESNENKEPVVEPQVLPELVPGPSSPSASQRPPIPESNPVQESETTPFVAEATPDKDSFTSEQYDGQYSKISENEPMMATLKVEEKLLKFIDEDIDNYKSDDVT